MKEGFDTHSSSEWKMVVAESLEEIENIRVTWEQMHRNEPQHTLDSDIDRYLSVVKSTGDDVQPYVVLMEHYDQPAAMMIGRIEKHELKLKLAYRDLLSPRLRCLSVVYGGILGQPDGELCSLLVCELMRQLRSPKIDIVYFNHLRTETCFYQTVRNMPGFLTRGHLPKVREHWRMPVPEKIDQFYLARSRKHRYKLRRAIKRFEDEYSGGSTFAEYTSESDVNDFMEKAADISSKTYQNALGVGIVNDEQEKCLIKAAAVRGWFRGHILFAGDIPCAFLLGLGYKGVYYGISTGYDPAFRSYWPGTILFLKVLESLCADPSIEMFDFYFGDAWYKRCYGTECWPEACIYIFAPRLYPILINALRSSMMGLNAFLHHVVNKIGYVGWIKRRWRDSLQSKNPPGER